MPFSEEAAMKDEKLTESLRKNVMKGAAYFSLGFDQIGDFVLSW